LKREKDFFLKHNSTPPSCVFLPFSGGGSVHWELLFLVAHNDLNGLKTIGGAATVVFSNTFGGG